MWLLELILLVVAWALFRVAEALGKNKEKECDHQYENKREQRKLEKKSRKKREKNKKKGNHKKIARRRDEKRGEKEQKQRDNKDEKPREQEKESKIPSLNSTTDNMGKEKGKAISTIATSDLYYLLTLVIKQQKREKNNEKMTNTPPATIQPVPMQNVILDFSQFLAVQIPLPGQPGAPYFDGKEVMKFVRSWERFSERYKIADKKMVNELVDYCEVNTGEYVATIIDKVKREIQGANLRESWWPKVRTGLLKNFKSDDSKQQRNTVTFLRSLSSDKPFRMKAEEVERYIRTYQQISNTLVSEIGLTAFDQMICFLQGLPDNTATKIFEDMKFDVDEPATFSANGGFSGAVTIALTMTRK